MNAVHSAMAAHAAQDLPLKGIRIVDFTWIGAGSFTTKILADFGEVFHM